MGRLGLGVLIRVGATTMGDWVKCRYDDDARWRQPGQSTVTVIVPYYDTSCTVTGAIIVVENLASFHDILYIFLY
jgi:hypothetical protein